MLGCLNLRNLRLKMRNLPLQLDNLRLVLSHQVCDFELMARLNFNRDFILFSDLEQLKLQ